MSFDSFDAVRTADDARLRELLRSCDGPERVWAAWALGLLLGGDAVSVLAEGYQPNPGVRAHLIVVLAGFGQQSALRALASDDPDPAVRATGCDYLIRIASLSHHDEVQPFPATRALTDPSPVPVTRIPRALPAGWPTFDDCSPRSFVRDGLGHEVIDHLLRTRDREDLPVGWPGYARRWTRSCSSDLRTS